MLMERLDQILKEKDMSRRELERKAGLGVGTTTKWKDRNPITDKLKKVSEVLGVSVSYLTGESDFRTEQDALIHKWNQQMSAGLVDEVRRIEAGIRIPVLGAVPCGIPSEAVEYLDSEEWEEISEQLSRSGNFYGLKVKGDSMSPLISEGDVLIIQAVPDAESGSVVIVKVNGEEACCKRILKQDEGIVLQSFNPCYEPMYFNREEVLKKPVQIVGKVVECRKKF